MIFMLHFIFICHTCLTLLSLYERTLTVLSLSSNTLFASNGVFHQHGLACVALHLECATSCSSWSVFAPHLRFVPLPPLVCLERAVFSSWKTSKFCASD